MSHQGHEVRRDRTVLPSRAASALARGKTIEAIRVVRKELRLGLKEAKELVERHQRGGHDVQPITLVPSAAVAALHKGWRIEAIRIVREQTHVGLKEAKEIVDAYLRAHPRLQSAVAAHDKARNRRLLTWVAILVLASVAVYLLTRPQ
jgi:ribosomal protein L7/L12